MKKITIFGRPGCGFCLRAKQLCEINDLDFQYIDIWKEGISQQDLQKTVGQPVSTVPQVFCGQEYVGGFTELESYLKKSA